MKSNNVSAPPVVNQLACYRVLLCAGMITDADTGMASYLNEIETLHAGPETLGKDANMLAVANLFGQGKFDVAFAWRSADGQKSFPTGAATQIIIDGMQRLRSHKLRLPLELGAFLLTIEYRPAGNANAPWQRTEGFCTVVVQAPPVEAVADTERPEAQA